MRDGPTNIGTHSNDHSAAVSVGKGVVSEGEPSFMLSDGGTRRPKYADIVSLVTFAHALS